MAQRRMFSTKIVKSDAFLDMPQTSQLLYFHLGIEADDDGFVGNPKRIMKMIGAGDDDFKILLAKRFVLQFHSGIVVIKHWMMQNSIRADRYVPTQYQEEKNQLAIKENGAYTEMATSRQPSGTKWLPQVKLSKVNTSIPLEAEKEDLPPFNSDHYIKTTKENKRRAVHVIGLFWEFKSLVLPSQQSAQAELKRNLRVAADLEGYSDKEITTTMQYIDGLPKRDYIWGLETVKKMILSVINNRN